MTSNAIKKLLQASPFVRFRMHMGNGRMFDVKHPEFVLIHPNGREAVVAEAGEDGVEILDILMIQSIETLPPRATKNGKRGRAA